MKDVMIPQEVEVWYVIPALRRELTKAMQEKGMMQKDIAKKLHITEAAVSQYIKLKRAVDIVFDNKTKKEVERSAAKIMKDDNAMIKEIQRLLGLMKKERSICVIHKRHCNLPKDCDYCYK
jgi:predicted transcriptional regulator